MPSWLTHFAVVTKTFERINKKSLKEVLVKNPTYVFLGGIYADMYYAGILPFTSRWSDMMHHEKTGQFACELLINCNEGRDCKERREVNRLEDWLGKNEKKDKEIAFALGYLTHIAADITIHPFTMNIIREKFREKSDAVQSAEHARCEVHQDSYIYYECENSLFSDCNLEEYIEVPYKDRGDAFFRKFPSFLVKVLRESHSKVYGGSPKAIEIELSYVGAVYALNTQVVISSREIDRRCIEFRNENYKMKFEEAVEVASLFLQCACEYLDGKIKSKELREVILDWNLDSGEML